MFDIFNEKKNICIHIVI